MKVVVLLLCYEGNNTTIKKIKENYILDLNIGNAWDTVLNAFGMSTGAPFGNQAGTVMAMACLGNGDLYLDKLIKHIYGAELILEGCVKNEQDDYDISNGLQRATEHVIKNLLSKYLQNKRR